MKIYRNALQAFCLLAFIACTTFTTQAQIQVGGGINYGTDIGEIGFTAKGQIGITEELGAQASFSIFCPDEDDFFTTDLCVALFEIFYRLATGGEGYFYPTMGLSYSIISSGYSYEDNYDTPGGEPTNYEYKETSSSLGLAIGAGFQYPINERLNAYSEVKYITGDASQAIIEAGVLISIP